MVPGATETSTRSGAGETSGGDAAEMLQRQDSTQLEHALQSAKLAEAQGTPDWLITAALPHDVGHLMIYQHMGNDDVRRWVSIPRPSSGSQCQLPRRRGQLPSLLAARVDVAVACVDHQPAIAQLHDL